MSGPGTLTIWVDADSCPSEIRTIIERAAHRVGVPAVLVSDRSLGEERPPWIRHLRVPSGRDAADNAIRERARSGDLAVTADIPLAAALGRAGVDVIHPRGDYYTAENVSERLATRNLLADLRRSGVETEGKRFRGGGKAGAQARQRFAAVLDRELTRRTRSEPPAQS